MPAAPLLVLALLLSVGSQSVRSQDAPADLSLAVQKVFLEKCGACHASHLKNPDGDFGFLDDLRRIAGDEDFVVAGDPSDSILFDSISLDPDDPDFMPPADADEAPLTSEEVEWVRRWIEQGAEVSDAAQALMGSLGEQALTPEDAAPEGEEGTEATVAVEVVTEPAPQDLGKRWRKFLGQFHNASTHLPIGLILGAVIAEFLSIFLHRERLAYVARFCLLFGTLGAAYSLASGWFKAEGVYGYRGLLEAPGMLFETTASGRPLRGNEVWWHRWLGVFSTAGSALACLLSLTVARRPGTGRLLYRLWLFLMAALISLVGFLGGKLVHGAEGAYHWL